MNEIWELILKSGMFLSYSEGLIWENLDLGIVKNVGLGPSWPPPRNVKSIFGGFLNPLHQIVCYSTIVNTQEWGFSIRKENENGIVSWRSRRKRMTLGRSKEECGMWNVYCGLDRRKLSECSYCPKTNPFTI